ncbi:MAG: MFS transporter [Planctomycetota bacterium]
MSHRNPESSKAAASGQDRLLPVSSWVLYDFANTIFYAIVVTRYLPLQLTELTGKHFVINFGFYPAMLASALLAPWVGRWAGARGLSIRTVGGFTIACCLFTACLGWAESAWSLLLFFALAQVFYQLALVPYNNLLPSVASTKHMGLVSGLGVGIGYAGVIVSLLLADRIIQASGSSSDYSPAYFVAAGLFLLFTLPMLFIVRERPTVARDKGVGIRDVLNLMKDRVCRRFIIGNFLCADALNALLVLIAVYLKMSLGFSDADLLSLFIVLNVSAMISGVLLGFLTDRLSARTVMPLAAAALSLSVTITHFSNDTNTAYWSIVLLGGPGVAGLWVAGRKWVVQLAPENDVGTLFGFYGLSNKISLINITLFTLLADWTGGYTASVCVLVVSLLIGIWVLLTVPAVRPGPAV